MPRKGFVMVSAFLLAASVVWLFLFGSFAEIPSYLAALCVGFGIRAALGNAGVLP